MESTVVNAVALAAKKYPGYDFQIGTSPAGWHKCLTIRLEEAPVPVYNGPADPDRPLYEVFTPAGLQAYRKALNPAVYYTLKELGGYACQAAGCDVRIIIPNRPSCLPGNKFTLIH